MADQQAVLKTNQGDITINLFPNHAPETVVQLHGPGPGHQGLRRRHRPHRTVLRRAHLPPGDPRLHDPGRLPARHRDRRPRLHLHRRIPPGVGLRQAVSAGDGQCRSRHQRLAVLHHRRSHPAAQPQAHDLRRGGRPGLARPCRRIATPHRRGRPAGRDVVIESVEVDWPSALNRPTGPHPRPPGPGRRCVTGIPTGRPGSAAHGASGPSAPSACATPPWASSAGRASRRARRRPAMDARRTAAGAPATPITSLVLIGVNAALLLAIAASPAGRSSRDGCHAGAVFAQPVRPGREVGTYTAPRPSDLPAGPRRHLGHRRR